MDNDVNNDHSHPPSKPVITLVTISQPDVAMVTVIIVIIVITNTLVEIGLENYLQSSSLTLINKDNRKETKLVDINKIIKLRKKL